MPRAGDGYQAAGEAGDEVWQNGGWAPSPCAPGSLWKGGS